VSATHIGPSSCASVGRGSVMVIPSTIISGMKV